jgi:hypothetical protein
MTSSATVIEIVRFRRLRNAVSAIAGMIEPDKAEVKAVDWYLPGFGGKARVSTVFGDLPIEALRLRDDVRTYSGATARVQMVDRIHLDEDFIRAHQSSLPIRIPANSFGPGKPFQDLLVSPGQEICSDAHVASSFLKAAEFRSRFSQDLSQIAGLTYYRFHCGEPTIVRVDGIWTRVQP